jgi:hypothetical protein
MGCEMKVKSVTFNWFYSEDSGEEFSSYTVGKTTVTKIEYHSPMGEGDRHYCDVYCEDGCVMRIFNLNSVEFEN